MQQSTAKELVIDPPVKDADGNVIIAYDSYERGAVTVLCNQTGAKVRLPDLKSNAGIIWLDPGDHINLEDVARPSAIEHSGLNLQLRPNPNDGRVTFTIHRIGTKPIGKPADVQHGPTGRPNQFDDALDGVFDKEKAEEERSARKNTRRTGDEGSIATVSKPRG